MPKVAALVVLGGEGTRVYVTLGMGEGFHMKADSLNEEIKHFFRSFLCIEPQKLLRS